LTLLGFVLPDPLLYRAFDNETQHWQSRVGVEWLAVEVVLREM